MKIKKHFCKTCEWFHKGVKVHHSHCDNPDSHLYREILKHNGVIYACGLWEKKLKIT